MFTVPQPYGSRGLLLDREQGYRMPIQNSDFYFEEASWQMVHACLGAQKKEKAKQLLEEILLKPNGQYYNQAKKLMESL